MALRGGELMAIIWLLMVSSLTFIIDARTMKKVCLPI
jgi:hypothetical protein